MDEVNHYIGQFGGEVPSWEFGRWLRLVITKKYGRHDAVDRFARDCRVHPEVVENCLNGKTYPHNAILDELGLTLDRAYYVQK